MRRFDTAYTRSKIATLSAARRPAQARIGDLRRDAYDDAYAFRTATTARFVLVAESARNTKEPFGSTVRYLAPC